MTAEEMRDEDGDGEKVRRATETQRVGYTSWKAKDAQAQE